jgi:hypothetical protein
MKLKDRYGIHVTAIFCYTRNIILTKVAFFLKTLFHTKFEDPEFSGTSVISTPQVCTTTVLVLLMTGN